MKYLLSFLCVAALTASAAVPEVMDMVHHNPGEPFTVTAYSDPAKLAAVGMDAMVVNEFVFPQCAVTFDAFDPQIFPAGSEERAWVMEQRARMREKARSCHAKGLKCYYFMDIIVLPTRLVERHRAELCDGNGRITFAKPLTEKLHRMMLDELFTVVPELDGVVVRTGETYLNNTPYHTGNGPVDYRNAYEESKRVHARLMNLLREEVCVKKNRRVYYRTWDFGCFHTDPAYYQEVTDQVPVHENFVVSVKHTKGDYLRTFAFNPTLGVGRHRQIVEVQCAREYEGKGAFVNYIADSVVNGYEETVDDPGLRSLAAFAKSPLFAGVWTWSRGGGSQGPFLKNEFWCDFNARVMARWAKNPEAGEAAAFDAVAEEVGILPESREAFRKLCLLSQQAIILGRGTMLKRGAALRPYMKEPDNWLFVGWMRDDCLGGEKQMKKTMDGLMADGLLDARLAEMREAVTIWGEIVACAKSVRCRDAAVAGQILTTALYGEVLHRVMAHGCTVVYKGYEAAQKGIAPDGELLRREARDYERAWGDFHRLAAERPDCASLYRDDYPHYIPKCAAVPSGVTHVEGLGASVRKYRAACEAAHLTRSSAQQDVLPLPEHPRPDWERATWQNLNGLWEFGFAPGAYSQHILVPFGWGSPASGVKDEGDTGYYRRHVTIPESWKGRRVFVVVGASDHDTTCVFDGESLGQHVGGYTPFEFELTDFVRWGEAQTLEFEVWDPPALGARNGHYLYGKQGYGNVRGIWQTVYLEARGEAYLEGVRFYPHVKQGSVTAVVTLGAPAKAPLKVMVEVEGAQHEIAFPQGTLRGETTIKLAQPRLWTLEDPYLYDVTLTLQAGRQKDVVQTYFGLREIGIGKNPNGDSYVTLNGKPIYLQLALDQSYHPEGWYTFPTDEFMKNEILISKRLALTGNRVHIKVEVPRKLYWADKLGLLIQADVPCAWGDASEAMFTEHWACFEGMVKRDFNHPSIYQWTLFNETWGLFSNRSLAMGLAAGSGGKKRAYRAWAQRRVANAYFKAKELDPTRVVEDNSPCNRDHVVSDVNTWHNYRPGYQWEATVKAWCEGTYPGSRMNYIGGHVQVGEPMMNSECGNVWGYRGSTGDCDFSWDYHLMMNAFRRHLKCAGWLYTEHHDVCNEWNGYVRFDRSPKYDGLDELAGMTLADFHRDAALFFAGTPGRETGEMLFPGQKVEIPVGVSLTTDAYAGKELTLQVNGVASGLPKIAKSWHNETLWKESFVAPSEPACGVLRFALLADGKEIAKNFWSYGVTNAAPLTLVANRASWSGGSTNVLCGLKLNGFGKGFFEFVLPAPAEGGILRAELSAKRKNGKDFAQKTKSGGIDYMLGGGTFDRSGNPNSYPQTSDERYPSNLKVYLNGALVKETTLADDPADHRGILSWLSQPQDGYLYEAGSYGFLVSVPVPKDSVKNGQVTVRLEADRGLAVYGPAFGRYPFGIEVR